MIKRTVTAIAALALFIPVLYFSDTLAFPIVVSALCCTAVMELLSCMKMLKKIYISVPSAVIAIIMPLWARYNREALVVILLVAFCYLVTCSVIFYKNDDITGISLVFFELFLIISGFTLLVVLRDLNGQKYLLVFIAAWMTDTFAIFAGRFFGRKKLCPDISPKKTVAGSAGGIIGAVIGFIVYGIIINGFFDGSEKLWLLAIIAVPLSAVGQIGDLSASLVKRHFGIKDYGKIFPGHGGVLDRFDSILPVSIMLYVILKVIPV